MFNLLGELSLPMFNLSRLGYLGWLHLFLVKGILDFYKRIFPESKDSIGIYWGSNGIWVFAHFGNIIKEIGWFKK